MERLAEIARKALLEGYGEIYGHRRVQLNLQMDCDDPYGMELHSRISARHGKWVEPFTVIVITRCRKCGSCKRRRSMFWTGRAISEFQQAPRTVFGTFTLSPDEHYRLDALAQARLRKSRIDFSQLSPEQIFTERARQFGSEVQLYLKRLRKGDVDHVKPKLRYLAIAEAHDSDATSPELRMRPHFHMLLHEMQAGALIKGDPGKAILEGSDGEYERRMVKTKKGWQPFAFVTDEAFIRKNWTLGYTKFQWASTANSAVYVCKYLTKALTVRVRASQAYGRDQLAHAADRAPNTESKASPDGESVIDDPQRTEWQEGASGEPKGFPRTAEK